MKTLYVVLAILLAGCAVALPAQHTGLSDGLQPDGSYVMVLNKSIAETCTAQGGCALVTSEGMVLEKRRAVEAACGRQL